MIHFEKSGVQIEVPQQAVPNNTMITLSSVSNPPALPEGADRLSGVYDIKSEVPTFEEPVRLSIPVPSDKWPVSPSELVTIATWDEELRDWVPLGSELDEQQKRVSTWVSHFSVYAVINWNPGKPNAAAMRTTEHFNVVGLSRVSSDDPNRFMRDVERLTPLVEEVARLLEEAWTLAVNGLRYRVQARDKKVWVWITPLVPGIAGFVYEPPETLRKHLVDWNIYLTPELDLTDPKDQGTPLHEFFHFVQVQGYLSKIPEKYRPALWWAEATSSWIMTKRVSEKDQSSIYRDYYHLTKTPFLRYSLDDPGDPRDAREYLAGVFASYLENRFGTEIIRRTWEILSAQIQAGQIANPLKAIENALSERGASLSDIYFSFALDYAYFRKSPWLSFLPAFKTEEVEASTSQQTKGFSLPHMSCQFNRLIARRDKGTLRVTANADPSIRYALIDEPSKNVVYPSTESGIQVASFGVNTKSAVLIACNAFLQDKREFQFSYTVGREVVQPPPAPREGISIGYVNEKSLGNISLDQLRARLKGMSGEKPDLVLQRTDVILFADDTKVVDLTQEVRSQANITKSAGSLLKVAYIHAERVFQDYKKTSEAVEIFRTEAEKKQQELKTLQDRFKRGLISERVFQQEGSRLQQEIQRLDLQLTSEIQGDMIEAIKQIAQEGKIDWVTQRKDVVLFGNPKVVLDLTDLVTRKLNGEQIDSELAGLPSVEPLRRVGYVRAYSPNTKTINQKFQEAEAIQQLRAAFEKKRQELQDVLKVLQDRFRKGLLSEDEFNRQGARVQQELQRLDIELTVQTQSKIIQAIEKLSKRENYDIVSEAQVILFANEAKITDLTDQVISYLNAGEGRANTSIPSKDTNSTVFTVCPSGCSFSRIQDAINAAAEGATIEIRAGTYYENLEITKSITLRGAGSDETKILGREVDKPVIYFARESVSEFQVMLKDLTIAGARGEQCPVLPTRCAVGVAFHSAMEASLEQVRVSDNQKAGIVVMADLVQLRLVRSEILNNGEHGVHFAGHNGTLEIRGSRFWGNGGCGISVWMGETEVRGAPNEMGSNGADLCGYAPAWLRQTLTSQTDQLLLRVPNDFSNLQAAIDAIAPGGTILIQSGHFNAGLTIWKSLTLQGAGASQTILTGLSKQGKVVSVIAEVQYVALKNLALTRGRDGITIKGKTQAVLQDLEISNNNWFGAYISGSANTSILNARISQNGSSGIYVSLDATLNVQNSIIEENGTGARCSYTESVCSGISIFGPSQVLILDSIIRNNADWGISSYLRVCRESTDYSVPAVVFFEGQNVITGNNHTGNHSGQGNPGNHPWNLPDGQICLP